MDLNYNMLLFSRNDAKEKLNQEKDNSSGEDSTFSVKNV